MVWTPAHLLPAACVEELLVHWKHESHFVWRRVRRKRVVLLLEDLLELSKLPYDRLRGERHLDHLAFHALLEDELESAGFASRHTTPELHQQL